MVTNLEPARVAGDMAIPALHDGRQGDPSTYWALQVCLGGSSYFGQKAIKVMVIVDV